jgi:predicted HNH restriction endonuclease
MTDKSDQALLAVLAQEVFQLLSERKYGTSIRLRKEPSDLPTSHTDGWVIEFGNIRLKKCYLQIWFDRFTRYSDRKVWYGFSSGNLSPIAQLAKNAQKNLGSAAKLDDEDLYNLTPSSMLLRKEQFGQPIIERYDSTKAHFYGMYEFKTPPHSAVQRRELAERIVVFYETVARSLPDAAPPSIENDAFPKQENRKIVRQHIQRERSGYLATLRKQKDQYKCQICGMRFEEVYGAIGTDFAEAHHIVPLSKIKGATTTTTKDLITVCANCHKMLHRLTGKALKTALAF